MSLLSKILNRSIRNYQRFLSPLLGANKCRFSPTCSNYAITALKVHGSTKGSWLTIKRIIRCNPLCLGGVDPVPKKLDDRKNNNGS